MLRLGVGPPRVEDRIRKLAAVLLIQGTDLQENLREDVLIESRVTGCGECDVLPLEPARRVDERAVLLGKTRARQTIDRRLDRLHLLGCGAGRLPEFAGLV